MKNESRITLTKEQKQQMVKLIQAHFLTEREEQIGDLQASVLLNFITKELAPVFYNQGVQDAYRYLADRCEDMLSLQI